MEGIEKCTGKKYDSLNVVGGGTKDTLLCKMTADACNITVYAGPIEATVMGNVAVQLISGGDLADVIEARRIIANSGQLKCYSPENTAAWDEAYEKFKSVTK